MHIQFRQRKQHEIWFCCVLSVCLVSVCNTYVFLGCEQCLSLRMFRVLQHSRQPNALCIMCTAWGRWQPGHLKECKHTLAFLLRIMILKPKAFMKSRRFTWNWDCDLFPLLCCILPPLQDEACDWCSSADRWGFEVEEDWSWSRWDWQVVRWTRLGCESERQRGKSNAINVY